jgi:hypothetical protein
MSKMYNIKFRCVCVFIYIYLYLFIHLGIATPKKRKMFSKSYLHNDTLLFYLFGGHERLMQGSYSCGNSRAPRFGSHISSYSYTRIHTYAYIIRYIDT